MNPNIAVCSHCFSSRLFDALNLDSPHPARWDLASLWCHSQSLIFLSLVAKDPRHNAVCEHLLTLRSQPNLIQSLGCVLPPSFHSLRALWEPCCRLEELGSSFCLDRWVHITIDRWHHPLVRAHPSLETKLFPNWLFGSIIAAEIVTWNFDWVEALWAVSLPYYLICRIHNLTQ